MGRLGATPQDPESQKGKTQEQEADRAPQEGSERRNKGNCFGLSAATGGARFSAGWGAGKMMGRLFVV